MTLQYQRLCGTKGLHDVQHVCRGTSAAQTSYYQFGRALIKQNTQPMLLYYPLNCIGACKLVRNPQASGLQVCLLWEHKLL